MGYPDWQTEGTLADLISSALAASGIPIVSNPVTLYNVLSPPPVGIPGLWGTSAFGGGQSETADIQKSDATIGRASVANRVYFQDAGQAEIYTSASQFPGDLAAAFNLGLTAVVSYIPTFKGTRTADNLPSLAQMQADQDSMVASLNSIIASGFPAANLRVVMRHEANDVSKGCTAAQYLNLYNGVASGGQSNYQRLHAICPVYSILLGNSNNNGTQITTYPPITPVLAANACDCLMIDYYAKPYTNKQWLGGTVPAGQHTYDGMARAANVPFAIGEFGGFGSFPLATLVQYLMDTSQTINGTVYPGDPVHSMAAIFKQRLADGLTNKEVIIFQNYTALPDYPAGVPQLLAAFHDALGTTGSSSIGAGASLVLTPEHPSPVAGYASAVGQSYDITINAVGSVAGSTNPILTVTMDWFNDDSATALPVATQKWSCPTGTNGTAGTTITGRGPQAGRYVRVTCKNNDTIGVVFSLQMNSTGRTVQRHDWRWEAGVSVAVPTYTLPGGDGNGLSLGSITSNTINPGATKSWLISMWAGRAIIKLAAYGAAVNSTVHVTLAPQPPGRWGLAPIFGVFLPDPNNAPTQEQLIEAGLVRGPCLLTVFNGDANAVTFSFEAVATEP